MSMPVFPEDGIDITREQAFNMLLGSIAMEELGLSHIINAEGEKLQYVLGTLPRTECQKVGTKELLEVNKSITTLLEHVAHNQFLLKGKLAEVLEAQEKWCPPPCPLPCPLPCCDPIHKVSLFRECGEDAWCVGQHFMWKPVSCCTERCSAHTCTTTVICPVAKTACMVNFQFELLPADSGQVAIELLQFNNGISTSVLKSGVYAPSTGQPVYLSGSTVVVPRLEDAAISSLAFILCEPCVVQVKKAKLTLTALC